MSGIFNGGNRYNQQCHLCAAENLASQDILNFSVSSPLPIRKWWNGYVNLWYNYQMFDGKIGENKVNVNIPSYGAYMQHTVLHLVKTIRLKLADGLTDQVCGGNMAH